MLATILKTDIASRVTMEIIDTFAIMRKYISSNILEQRYINNQVFKNTEDIKILQNTLNKFEEKKNVNEIFFEGQIYDAYSKIVDIMNEANNELIIIDGYADKSVLDIISKLKVKVTLIVRQNGILNTLDIEKYKKQYNNLTIIYSNDFHDRFIIIDKHLVYHLGASINHAGSKVFAINKLEENCMIELLINKVNKIY